MRLLILGAKGMLGQALMRTFSHYRPIGWGIMDIDITDKKRIQEKILQLKPEIIINAAAYTDVDMAQKASTLAKDVNGNAVGYIAQAAKTCNALLVHYGTDYVFDGKDKKGYAEDAQPNPINEYGKSKLVGEQEITNLKHQNPSFRYYLIRTSWLFGHGGRNFVKTILEKAKNDKKVHVVNDQFGKPTYTVDLANATNKLIFENFNYGIYHITNETKASGISWYDFAKKAVEIKNINAEVEAAASVEYQRPAKRPKYSLLKNTKFPKLRDWTEALKDYI